MAGFRARVEGFEDGWVARDLDKAEKPDRAEPKDNDRAKKTTNPARPVALQHKQRDQHGKRQWQHKGFECRGCDFEPLDGAQHRNRGRQHAITKEQRQAKEPGPEDPT